jgi:V8-like Glu-specific endopeptidase
LDGSSDPEIFPPDGRTLVTNTLPVPFRFVCCLEVTFVNPSDTSVMIFERGTGTLISDRHVLTAAHVVFEDISGRDGRFPARRIRAQTILVAPARNDRDLPFGFSDVTTVRVTPAWQTGGTAQNDFALLTLATAMGRQGPVQPSMQLPAPQLGFWSSPDRGQGTRIRPIELSKLRGQPLNLAGYPIDKCRRTPLSGACQGTIPGEPDFHERGSTQWVSTDRCVDPAPADMPAMITYMADSAQGQSGGPVWLNWQGFRNLVAVNTGGYPRRTAPHDIIANMGVRITDSVLSQLRAWMRADGVSATF